MKTKRKILLTSTGAILSVLPLATVISCDTFKDRDYMDSRIEKDDDKKDGNQDGTGNNTSQPGSGTSDSGTGDESGTKEQKQYDDFPMPKFDASGIDGYGLKEVWDYILQIPDIVKRKNQGQNLATNDDLYTEKVKELYETVDSYIGDYTNWSDNLNPQEYKQKYKEDTIKFLYDRIMPRHGESNEKLRLQTEIWVNNPARLFILEKSQKEIESIPDLKNAARYYSSVQIPLLTGLFITNNLKLTDFMKAYMEYQKFLFTKIKDKSKTIEEHLTNNEELKFIIERLSKAANLFLSPNNFLSSKRTNIWNEWNKNPDREVYEFIINLYNNEVAPISIKFLGEDMSQISPGAVHEIIQDYFYDNVLTKGLRIKIQFSESEVNKAIDEFKKKAAFYHWKYKK
ncbi:hypothetical protein [Mycoplasma procyoni]|uniref:hypothetical protein n=1 Tax=Mycoplasma procyoni TaxID=568784 RepID=UPI00197C2462|nr:hypothetical protein [Mycoplasma procyoni]MBN3534664.1 hypothetical protein [Mycoplasma procyoni]